MSALFETDRLTVRRFESKDAADIAEFAGDPSVADEIPNVPWQDPVKLLEYIETQQGLELFAAHKCVDLAIERKSDRKVIGLLSFVSNGQRQGEIGWALGVEHRGSGYATEAVRGLISFAFASCGYHRIFAGTILTNERSWKLMERVGMRKEAHFREAHVPAEPGGPWIDSTRYAVLASEWPVHPAH
jgi:RimJ/RimL family protein N-acetyltransferase